MVELQQVSKSFGDAEAVKDLSFHISGGETFGLIGTSGCGKTTTLKMINRLIEPDSGTIRIEGREISFRNPEELRRRIGYVIQDVGLFPHYSVAENIAVVPKLLKWDGERIDSRCRELMELVGLPPAVFAERKPDSLSGGQQQRVGLARALAADPPVVLMDEPFGALDPITRRHVRKEVGELFRKIRKTIVLVTHDVFEAFEMCDRLCLLDDGKMQQTGTPKELLFRPANEFVDSFFRSDRFQLELLSITVADIVSAANTAGRDPGPTNGSGEGEEGRAPERGEPDKAKKQKSKPEEPERRTERASGTGEPEKREPLRVHMGDSLLSVLEEARPGRRFAVVDDRGEISGHLSPGDLMNGFQKVRKTLREEDDNE